MLDLRLCKLLKNQTMRRLSLIFFFVFGFIFVLLAQNKPYFQQRVDYIIHVKIYPTLHYLTAYESIVYKNNSPDTLRFLYFHLWPNGYTKNSALARQQAKNGKAYVQFDPQYRGYIDSLDFRVDGQKIKWEFYKSYKDIAILYLPEPLAPGEKITITTPFFVKIPRVSSRMGYNDKAISISQWYPKPAVYDKYGWHAFPYLDQGEFYSEFGSFDVKITVPSQYVVAATGNLLDTTEENWRKQLTDAAGYQVKYPTGKPWKTLHFYQDSIHDFAIFLSDQYRVRQSQIKLPHSGRIVKTYAYFYTPGDWEDVPEYIDSAIYYYSLWVGDYPYRVASAVQGPLTSGGGMEYPTITVISSEKNLEQVVVHEVGHNWFYGILGFNERRYPFLDEGINSYYDHRYANMHHGAFFYVNSKGVDMAQLYRGLLSTISMYNMNLPLNLKATDYSKMTYGLIVYEKSARAFRYLEKYLGTRQFDKIMQAFFEKWKFKHPYPEDLQQVFQSMANKPVDWFFDNVVATNKLQDYSVFKSKNKIFTKNTGQYESPMIIGNQNQKKWVYLKPKEKQAVFDNIAKTQVDPDAITLDWYPYNNYYTGKFPLKLRLLMPKFFDYSRYYVAVAPMVNWNEIDHWLWGIGLHNFTLPLHKFNFALFNFYSFHRSKFRQMAYFNYKIPTSNGRPAISLNIYGDNFGMLHLTTLRRAYAKVSLDLFNRTASDKVWKTLELGAYYLHSPDYMGFYFSDGKAKRLLGYIGFQMYKRSNFHPYKAQIYGFFGDVNSVGFEAKYIPLYYTSLKTYLQTRMFVGWQAPLTSVTPETDFTMGSGFPYRFENSNFWTNKLLREGYGGFVLNTYLQPYNVNNRQFVAAVNVVSTMPVDALSFIRLFADLGYKSSIGTLWETGVGVSLNGINVYFPLLIDDRLKLFNPDFKPFHTFRIVFSVTTFREILSKL